MRTPINLTPEGGIALVLTLALIGCGKTEQTDPREAVKMRAAAKRQQAACGSSVAYDRLKGLLFDQAIGQRAGSRADLDTLADYSFARMENPVVTGWNPALDVIQCKGHLVVEIPPGAERAFAGERRLQADVDYSAQAAADGSGFVYQLRGAEPIVAKLAAFNLTSGAYQPPPAIDEQQGKPDLAERTASVQSDMPAGLPNAAPSRSMSPEAQRAAPPILQRSLAPDPGSRQVALKQREPEYRSMGGEAGEAVVRAFYDALGGGDGATASAQIIPEKRSSGAFSPVAISRFYGKLPEPMRLTEIVQQSRGTYRVSYRYSAGRSHCNGNAIVKLTNRGGREFIRSIAALSGC